MSAFGSMFWKPRWPFLAMAAWLLAATASQAQELRFRQALSAKFDQPLKITHIGQDESGYLWLGTDRGLYRYDGLEILRSDLEVQSSEVSGLGKLEDGRIWAGFATGEVLAPDAGEEPLLAASDSAAPYPVRFFEELPSGFAVATGGKGLGLKRSGKLEWLDMRHGLHDNNINGLIPLGHDRLFLATDRGATVMDLSGSKIGLRHIGKKDGLPDDMVTATAVHPDGYLWVGGHEGGIAWLDSAFGIHRPLAAPEWQFGTVNRMLWLNGSELLVASERGLLHFTFHRQHSFRCTIFRHYLNGMPVEALCADQQGNIWAAEGNRLWLANGFFRYDGSPAGNVSAIAIDSKGDLYYARDGKINVISTREPDLPRGQSFVAGMPRQTSIVCMHADRSDLLWIGTFDRGVYIYDPEKHTGKWYTESDGLANNSVLSISSAPDGSLWMATLGGVSRCYRRGADFAFESYDEEDGLGTNFIYQAFTDRNGRIWLASDGKGISVYSGGAFTNFGDAQGLSSRIVYSIAEDTQGHIWASTPDKGLYRYDGRSFENFDVAQGLHDRDISTIASDGEGRLLIVHRGGLGLLDTKTLGYAYFAIGEGAEMLNADLNTAALDPSGRIWAGTRSGLLQYVPDGRKSIRPQAGIDRVSLFPGIGPTEVVDELKYDENYLTFACRGIWYDDPADVRFQYKLEEMDLDWVSSRDRTITYPALRPGRYVFHMRASVGNNFEPAPVSSYSFTIHPPFWQQRWFVLLSMLVSTLLLAFIIRTRENRLRKAQELERDALRFQFEALRSQVNPHFLFNSFNTLINLIEEDGKTAASYVEKLSDYFRRILDYRQREHLSVREELSLLEPYYFLQKHRFAESLQLLIEVDPEAMEAGIPPLTLQVLVENAVKHNEVSKAHPLVVIIRSEGERLLVRNALRRRRVPESGHGFGLEYIDKQVRSLTGRPVEILNDSLFFSVFIPLAFRKAGKGGTAVNST
jgi:ligand-binding sensor domain-containing protein